MTKLEEAAEKHAEAMVIEIPGAKPEHTEQMREVIASHFLAGARWAIEEAAKVAEGSMEDIDYPDGDLYESEVKAIQEDMLYNKACGDIAGAIRTLAEE